MSSISRRAMLTMLGAASLAATTDTDDWLEEFLRRWGSPSPSPTPTGSPSPEPTATATPTPTPSATATPTPSPEPTSSAEPEGPAPVAPAAPAPVARSFGPDGTHWPTRTPRPGDVFDLTLVVACSWTAIANAITTASAQFPQGNVRILVEPGVLPGNGAGSTKKPVLAGIGSATRGRRILVMPRAGRGSISFSGSIRLDRVAGVSFVGFSIFPYSMVFTGVSNLAWAWSKGRAFNVSTHEIAEVRDLELVECVTPESQLTESDAWAARTAGNPMANLSLTGCYIASMYKPTGSSAHLDSFQLSGTHALQSVTMKDTVIFASTNAAFIPTVLASGVLFDHSLVVAGTRMLQRYPLPAGARAINGPQAANGTGTNGVMSAKDSILIGSVPGVWGSVTNSSTSAAVTYSNSGTWTHDPGLSSVDAAWLEQVSPTPSDTRLNAIWRL